MTSTGVLSALTALGLVLSGPALAQEAPQIPEPPVDVPEDPAANTPESAPVEPEAPETDGATAENSAPDAPAADPAAPENRIEIRATHGAWQLRCAPGTPNCFMYQLVADSTGNPVAEFNIVRIEDDTPAQAGVNVLTPLGTLLPPGLVLRIDSGQQRQYPFAWCDVSGCLARFAFSEETVGNLKSGANATVTLFSIADTDTPVELTLSLTGFTAAFDSLEPVANQ